MCKKLIYVTLLFSLGLVAIPAGVVSAEDFVTRESGANILFRQTDGQVVWTSTEGLDGTPTLILVGPDGNVYISTSNNQDCKRWNGETGEYLGMNIENIGHRLYGICFGPDVDGDGVEDLYTFGGAAAVVNSYTSSSDYTEQGSWEATVDGGAWVGDFGPDLTDDGVQELYVLPALNQNLSNILIVIDGATKTEHSRFAIPLVNRPGCLVAGSDGRIYITGRNNDVIVSYLPDGTDPLTVVGSEGSNFTTQIAEGKAGEWYLANRFNVTGLPADAGSLVISKDNFATTEILIAGSVADDLYNGVASFDSPNMKEGPAKAYYPKNGATDVPHDSALTWVSGPYAAKHEVYFGSSFEDVNAATTASAEFKGEQELADTSYDPGTLAFNTSYFWRIDEVNDAHPDKLWKGDVWSFEVEPEALLVTQLTAMASSQNSPEENPNNTINGVGLNEDGSHSQDKTTMWLSAFSDPGTAWIRYDLPAPQKLNEMLVWNHNTQSEEDLGYGIKDALIEVSADGVNFTSLGTVELLQAAETTVDLQDSVAQSVKITAQNNWGDLIPKFGLSAVRLYAIPNAARELNPADGTANVDPPTAVLTWRAGREADVHNVYLSTDEQAVIEGTAPMVTVPETSYVSDLDLDMSYYWRVDEVNDAEVPAVWVGGVQSFSTAASIMVDDMESYKVNMWETWADGYEDPTNGALVGNGWEATPETEIVYEGSQSMPMTYGDAGIQNSWATRAIDSPKDWSQHGIKSLSLFFHGSADNVIGQLYVKINDTQFDYPGAATDIQTAEWFPWTIDLSGITTVNELTIGVLGGSGQIYVDNMRLYPSESE
ncbi:discoidin domain-containing protein [Planctomycetota bacterium]